MLRPCLLLGFCCWYFEIVLKSWPACKNRGAIAALWFSGPSEQPCWRLLRFAASVGRGGPAGWRQGGRSAPGTPATLTRARCTVRCLRALCCAGVPKVRRHEACGIRRAGEKKHASAARAQVPFSRAGTPAPERSNQAAVGAPASPASVLSSRVLAPPRQSTAVPQGMPTRHHGLRWLRRLAPRRPGPGGGGEAQGTPPNQPTNDGSLLLPLPTLPSPTHLASASPLFPSLSSSRSALVVRAERRLKGFASPWGRGRRGDRACSGRTRSAYKDQRTKITRQRAPCTWAGK